MLGLAVTGTTAKQLIVVARSCYKRLLTHKGKQFRALSKTNRDFSYCRMRTLVACMLFAIVTVLTVMMSVNSVMAQSTGRDSREGQWRYFIGTNTPSPQWNQMDFDDTLWLRGPGGLGYGTRYVPPFMLQDMKGRYRRVYARRLFNVGSPQAITKLSLSIVCDGPFVVYLNGMMALRNIIGLSTEDPAGGSPIGEELDISGWAHELNPGQNVITVQCDNDEIDSDDFIFIPSLQIVEDNRD